MEIERKFLVAELPDLSGSEPDEIEQGYLAVGTEGEVRLRRTGERLALTVKRGSGLSREEFEIDLEAEQFDALWPATGSRRVRKRRHRIAHGALTIELDVYAGALEGLEVCEVEFESESDAESFDPPDWFGEEITGVEAYANESLATKGAP
jgi:adenylate cyclase